MKIISALPTWHGVKCKSILSFVGLALKVRLNILGNEKYCITLILIVPNSVQLKMQPGAIILFFL